ncbi:hypothetical protein Nepgr_009356 [Nepenthes gracilis]|uniref:Uncharacterized protein n=1 Tax=Nepenthes gracilis TaxID=150966 RepID=A0AAD3XKA9_NEPGR|nr:hypothetical protein Nepgr_009356 [Nepenthes gracilis]
MIQTIQWGYAAKETEQHHKKLVHQDLEIRPCAGAPFEKSVSCDLKLENWLGSCYTAVDLVDVDVQALFATGCWMGILVFGTRLLCSCVGI